MYIATHFMNMVDSGRLAQKSEFIMVDSHKNGRLTNFNHYSRLTQNGGRLIKMEQQL